MTKVIRNEISVYTALMSLMVVFAHVVSEAVTRYSRDSILYAVTFSAQKICYFIVAGFLFVSAVKYFRKYAMESDQTQRFRYSRFLSGRITKVYLPYVAWVLTYYLYFVIIRNYFQFNIVELLRYIAVGDIAAQLYFILIIMQFYLLMPLWRFLAKPSGHRGAIWAVLLTVSAVIMFITKIYYGWFEYNDRIFPSYLFYWMAGMFFGIYYENFIAFLRKYTLLVFAAYATVGIPHVWLSYMHSIGQHTYAYQEQFNMLFYSVSIIFFYTLSLWIAEHLPTLVKAAKEVDAASFYIYLGHVLAINVAEQYTEGMNLSVRTAIKGLFTFVSTVGLSILYVQMKKKISTRLSRAVNKS